MDDSIMDGTVHVYFVLKLLVVTTNLPKEIEMHHYTTWASFLFSHDMSSLY